MKRAKELLDLLYKVNGFTLYEKQQFKNDLIKLCEELSDKDYFGTDNRFYPISKYCDILELDLFLEETINNIIEFEIDVYGESDKLINFCLTYIEVLTKGKL